MKHNESRQYAPNYDQPKTAQASHSPVIHRENPGNGGNTVTARIYGGLAVTRLLPHARKPVTRPGAVLPGLPHWNPRYRLYRLR